MPKTSKKTEMNPMALMVDPRKFDLGIGLPTLPASLENDMHQNELKMAQKVAKEALSQLDAKKAQIIDPIAKSLAVIRKEFANARNPWEMILDGCKNLILEREHRLEAEKLKENKKLAKKAEKKGETQFAEDLLRAPVQTVQTHTEDVSIRRTWKAKITDAALVPVDYNGLLLRPIDEAQLNRLAKIDSMRAFVIPGVEWVLEKTVALF